MSDHQLLKLVPEPVLEQNLYGNWCCDICGHEEKQRDELLTHRIQHYLHEHSKECPICHKKFTQSSSLQSHLTVHTGLKKYRCKYCGRKFAWKSQLARHESLHTGKGLHNCLVCSKSFMTKWLMRRHMKVHDRNKSGTIEQKNVLAKYDGNVSNTETNSMCQECGSIFPTKECLAYHLLEHNLTKQEKSTSMASCKDDDSERNKSSQKTNNSKNLTTIVSKLHHKVDEKQIKHEGEGFVKVQVLESNNIDDSSMLKVNTDFHISRSIQDPFISGMHDDSLPDDSPIQSETITNDLLNSRKQNELIRVLRGEITELLSRHTREMGSLHNKVDSLTNLVTSQSLILNRMFLGGKMSLSGVLDFSVHHQQNNALSE